MAPVAPHHPPATPLQRIRLVSLGLPVHPDLTSDWADDMLARVPDIESGRPTEHQTALAESLGVAVDAGDTRGSLGERVYEFYLAVAWVYSVWRAATGERSPVWAGLSLTRPRALAAARELVDRGTLDGVRASPTGAEDSDLFCAVDGETLLTDAGRVTLRVLGLRPRASRGWSLRKLFS